ncbi:MAG: NUDIX domain-containing protein [Pseudonocardiaceae bacterium]
MQLREDVIRRPDASQGIYSYVEKPDFALIIPVEQDGFHLVEQYRYPVSHRSWEFPQGSFPDRRDGNPQQLARRELAEETGLRAGHIYHLGPSLSRKRNEQSRLHPIRCRATRSRSALA